MQAPIRFALAAAALVAGCTATSSQSTASAQGDGTAHPDIWPQYQYPVPRDPAVEAKIADLLKRMTLEEKIGQLVQADICCVTPADVKKYHLGSILVGGNSGPNGNDFAPAPEWLKARRRSSTLASVDTSDGGVGIPMIWGIDAVHGHANIIGATMFPHNIGLGAMRDPDADREDRRGDRAGSARHRAGMDLRADRHRAAGLSLGPRLRRLFVRSRAGRLLCRGDGPRAAGSARPARTCSRATR